MFSKKNTALETQL